MKKRNLRFCGRKYVISKLFKTYRKEIKISNKRGNWILPILAASSYSQKNVRNHCRLKKGWRTVTSHIFLRMQLNWNYLPTSIIFVKIWNFGLETRETMWWATHINIGKCGLVFHLDPTLPKSAKLISWQLRILFGHIFLRMENFLRLSHIWKYPNLLSNCVNEKKNQF